MSPNISPLKPLLLSLLFTFSWGLSLGQAQTHQLLNNSSTVGGLSFAQLSELWWVWASSVPDDRDPVRDLTGEHCAVGQEGDVWLLAGTYSNGRRVYRECVVPFGKTVVGPLINAYGDCSGGADQGSPLPKPSALSLEVNGAAYNYDDLLRQRGLMACGKSRHNGGFVFDGYYYAIRFLTRGEHRLRIRASAAGFSQDIEYRLIVR